MENVYLHLFVRHTSSSSLISLPTRRKSRLYSENYSISHLFLLESTMDAVDSVVDPLREFAKDSVRLVKRCHKPDRKEFSKVAVRTAIGFVVMGFVGFFVKLIFIPINNIIVGSG
ncbi:hypothetical protein LUZ60_000785 [Juncus effusus]|nr:hypothetical protein LUZ60_000785 [Juncus effusus]